MEIIPNFKKNIFKSIQNEQSLNLIARQPRIKIIIIKAICSKKIIKMQLILVIPKDHNLRQIMSNSLLKKMSIFQKILNNHSRKNKIRIINNNKRNRIKRNQ